MSNTKVLSQKQPGGPKKTWKKKCVEEDQAALDGVEEAAHDMGGWSSSVSSQSENENTDKMDYGNMMMFSIKQMSSLEYLKKLK